MDHSLIQQLNELNQVFYHQTAHAFNSSRSYYWRGWNKLVPYLHQRAQENNNQLTIMDIGCGNGRFGAFVAGQLPDVNIHYIGLDSSRELLQIAKTHQLMNYIDAQFIELDIVQSLLQDTLLKTLAPYKADFMTALGVLHHVPSFQLRQQFIRQMGAAVTSQGYVVFTTWNFLHQKRFQKKIMKLEQFDLEPDQLEEGDVILDWKRGETAYRYCHYTSRDELDQLISESKLSEISRFFADGRNGKLNTYTVLQK